MASTPPTRQTADWPDQQQRPRPMKNQGQQHDDARRRQQGMQQQLVPGLCLFFCRATEFRIHAGREFHLLRHLLLRLGHERGHVASGRIAGDGLPPPRAVMQDGVTAGGKKNLGQLIQLQAQRPAHC